MVVSVKKIGLLSLIWHLLCLTNIAMRWQPTVTMLLMPYGTVAPVSLARFLGTVNPEILRQIQIFTCQEPRDAAGIESLRSSIYSTRCKSKPIRIPLTKTTVWLMTSWLVTSALTNCRRSGSGQRNSMASDASRSWALN